MGDLGAVDLFWIPLGAGACAARAGGRVYEGVVALLQRRPRSDLYHSALEVHAPEGRYVIEQTPVPVGDAAQRGVVAGGAVGVGWLGRFRIFRYEVRRWLGGTIPDLGDAVGGGVRLCDDTTVSARILERVCAVPTPVWGRDQLRVGEMWNSNSVIAWTLASAGVDLSDVRPPDGGRAPGWNAGVVVAARQSDT